MIISRFFLGVLCMMGCIILEPMMSMALSTKLPCRLRNSNSCKNPKYFKKDLKDKCAGPKTNCRQKFCQYTCFGSTIPEKESDTYRLCQLHCDPTEMTSLSRPDRLTFQERFEDKTVRRKHELKSYIDTLLSRLPWCEGECDYDESNPTSCQNKHAKADDHWAVCAQNCHFIKDIKEHAEQCAMNAGSTERPIPKPRTRPQ